MNERIKELAELAWDSITVQDGINDEALVKYDQKFAELIVLECCQKLENDGMVEVAMELKEHFGVEE